MTDAVIAASLLRLRMISDMSLRNLLPAAQRSYLHAVTKFSCYFCRSPDRLGLEDVRAFQVHLVSRGISWPELNQTMYALRFLYGVTLDRGENSERIAYARTPRKLLLILSADAVTEVVDDPARLLAAGLVKRVAVHTIRHSFATHLLESGEDIRIIQVLLRHNILSTTTRNTHVATTTIPATQSPLDRLSLEVVPPV